MSSHLPNFLHLGPGKSGSTWLHEVLVLHPEIYLTPAKDLYFFSRYYERGRDWYAAQFDQAEQQAIIGEVCPDYLVHPQAAERIHATLGSETSLMVTLRDPVDRAFSSFLYLQKHGLAEATFQATAQRSPELLDEGRYGTLLRRYLGHFPASQIHLAIFDDLENSPQSFLDGVTDWLGVSRQQLSAEQAQPKLPASAARSLPLARVAQRGADWLRARDGASLVGRVKRSPLVQRVLYRPLGDDKPAPTEEDVAFVHAELADELAAVEAEFDIKVRSLWGWA